MQTRISSLSLLILLALPLWATAQSIESVLAQVELHNPQLHALDGARQAGVAEARAQVNVGHTAVEYSPFYSGGAAGMASSELVVSQELDLATLTAQRSRLARTEEGAIDCHVRAQRQEVLHQARLLCLQLIYQRRLAQLLTQRRDAAARLATLTRRRLEQGACTAIEMNRVLMEQMEQQTALAECQTAIDMAYNALVAMNGGEPLALEGIDYPALDTLSHADALVEMAMSGRAEVEAAAMERHAQQRRVGISRMEWLPQLSVGYRRNTDLEQASHGILVGASMPLFSQHRRIRAAKARLEAVRRDEQNIQAQLQAALRAQACQYVGTLRTLRTLDAALMQHTLQALATSADEGQITATEYCNQAQGVYAHLAHRLALEHLSHTLWAELTKGQL